MFIFTCMYIMLAIVNKYIYIYIYWIIFSSYNLWTSSYAIKDIYFKAEKSAMLEHRKIQYRAISISLSEIFPIGLYFK